VSEKSESLASVQRWLFDDRYSRYSAIPARDRQTDGPTHRTTMGQFFHRKLIIICIYQHGRQLMKIKQNNLTNLTKGSQRTYAFMHNSQFVNSIFNEEFAQTDFSKL